MKLLSNKARKHSRIFLKNIYYYFLKKLGLWNSGIIQQQVQKYTQECFEKQESRIIKLLMQERAITSNILRNLNNISHGTAIKAPEPLSEDTLNESLAKIKELAPSAYAVWLNCQHEGEKAYEGYSLHSCSVDGHNHAALFRDFIAPYLRGTVLDIGCGPQPLPSYLSGYPTDLIAGIDPILGEAHPFVFAKGIAEFLPWKNHSFDVVVVGTSLDHAILLDRVYSEIHRVLKPKGHCLVWVGFTPNATEYNPYSKTVIPFDKYHLFHFDRPWFEKSLSKHFEIAEVYNFKSNEVITEAFYVLKARDNP